MRFDKEYFLAIVRTMAKVTSKLQITIPKAIAEKYGLRPGSEIRFAPAGSAIRMEPGSARLSSPLSLEKRLALFDKMTQRLERLPPPKPAPAGAKRGWRREDLYAERLERYAGPRRH
jgi:AbrB family looped-hinge helix DNA binding protein